MLLTIFASRCLLMASPRVSSLAASDAFPIEAFLLPLDDPYALEAATAVLLFRDDVPI